MLFFTLFWKKGEHIVKSFGVAKNEGAWIVKTVYCQCLVGHARRRKSACLCLKSFQKIPHISIYVFCTYLIATVLKYPSE